MPRPAVYDRARTASANRSRPRSQVPFRIEVRRAGRTARNQLPVAGGCCREAGGLEQSGRLDAFGGLRCGQPGKPRGSGGRGAPSAGTSMRCGGPPPGALAHESILRFGARAGPAVAGPPRRGKDVQRTSSRRTPGWHCTARWTAHLLRALRRRRVSRSIREGPRRCASAIRDRPP